MGDLAIWNSEFGIWNSYTRSKFLVIPMSNELTHSKFQIPNSKLR